MKAWSAGVDHENAPSEATTGNDFVARFLLFRSPILAHATADAAGSSVTRREHFRRSLGYRSPTTAQFISACLRSFQPFQLVAAVLRGKAAGKVATMPQYKKSFFNKNHAFLPSAVAFVAARRQNT